MKKISIIFIIGCLTLMSSCTDGFDTMNTSTTSLTEENLSPKSLFVRCLWKGVSADYQRNYNLYDDQYAHYFSNCTASFKTGNFEYNDSWAECGWKEFYNEREKEYNDIATLCGTEGSYTDFKAMNEIWNCFMWLRATDRWGDIPYTGCSQGTAVAYMSQEKIYLDLLSRLDAACSSIGSSSDTQYDPGEYDLIYGGETNISKWKEFGYSLMLRMAMRISNVDPTDAKAYAAKANSGGTFTSYSDIAKITCDASVWEDYYDRIITNWNNATTDMDFLNYMRGATTGYARANTLDPRCPLWFTQGTYGYVGFKNGMAASNYPTDFAWKHYATINVTDGFFHFNESTEGDNRIYYPIENYSEVCFLKAEAVLRNYISGDAEEYYKEGITASMKEVSANCDDALAISDADITTYINGLPTWSSATTSEAKLKLIAVQKWIALFPNSQEGWSEFRRTGYPDDLTYPDISSSAVVTDGNWIQRISYPNNEYEYNEKNMPSDYQSSSSKYSKRGQYGLWWSLAGDGGTYAKGSTPSNKF